MEQIIQFITGPKNSNNNLVKTSKSTFLQFVSTYSKKLCRKYNKERNPPKRYPYSKDIIQNTSNSNSIFNKGMSSNFLPDQNYKLYTEKQESFSLSKITDSIQKSNKCQQFFKNSTIKITLPSEKDIQSPQEVATQTPKKRTRKRKVTENKTKKQLRSATDNKKLVKSKSDNKQIFNIFKVTCDAKKDITLNTRLNNSCITTGRINLNREFAKTYTKDKTRFSNTNYDYKHMSDLAINPTEINLNLNINNYTYNCTSQPVQDNSLEDIQNMGETMKRNPKRLKCNIMKENSNHKK